MPISERRRHPRVAVSRTVARTRRVPPRRRRLARARPWRADHRRADHPRPDHHRPDHHRAGSVAGPLARTVTGRAGWRGIARAQPLAPAELRLTSLCSPDPTATRRWRVSNANPDPVAYAWDVYGSPAGQAGEGVAAPGDSTFTTTTEAGPNTVRLFVDGAQHDVKASGSVRCP